NNILASGWIISLENIFFDGLNEGSLETAITSAIQHKHKLNNPLQYILSPDTEEEHVTKILQAAHLF
ncbi:hypothetical protein, partial [Sutterella wadsworthensis]|uniref:hypothetical protein n=1 Tax=Sutterella wadsworthensis TaxID=40545 RepID=UPI00396781ED